MIWKVDKYMDQMRETNVAVSNSRFVYFETEELAKTFIRERAAAAYKEAEAELKRAGARWTRVTKKFSSL